MASDSITPITLTVRVVIDANGDINLSGDVCVMEHLVPLEHQCHQRIGGQAPSATGLDLFSLETVLPSFQDWIVAAAARAIKEIEDGR